MLRRLLDTLFGRPKPPPMPTDDWTLHPPPPPYQVTHWREQVLLMNACTRHRVPFLWYHGELLVPLRDAAVVLGALPPWVRLLGLDGFQVEGYGLRPRMDYETNYDAGGATVERALADVADWPQDLELWVEPWFADAPLG